MARYQFFAEAAAASKIGSVEMEVIFPDPAFVTLTQKGSTYPKILLGRQ